LAILKKIRRKAGNYILNRKLKKTKRLKKLIGFESAKTVGVLFKTLNLQEFESIKQFLLYLNNLGIQVYALGFIDHKKIPDFYMLTKGLNYFTRKELNMYFIPKAITVDEFLYKQFDILVDLSVDDNFPLGYISNLSKARLKIGKMKNNRDCFDLMIDNSKNNTVSALIDHIKYYTEVITAN
jgi:hypothetical protein